MPKRTTLTIAILVVAAAAFASTFGFFYFRDNFTTHYPMKTISAADFRAGEIPYWNFHDGGGQPLAGNPNTLTFYPDNFLYLILPPHVAFNLHFLIHLAAAWLAMHALSRSRWSASLYVLSGAAISATAFYNLIVAIAVVPFAFWCAERRRPFLLGAAFGLLGLAGEPVVVIAAAIGVGILTFTGAPPVKAEGGRRKAEGQGSPHPLLDLPPSAFRLSPWQPVLHLAFAVLVSIVIALPQLIAYSEIAGEVERARGYSAQTVLNASLAPVRLAEILVGPFFETTGPRLFLSLFIGVIALPALLQRSRYTVIALVALFFALGAYNPLVRIPVEQLPWIRIVRFPEKFAIVLTVAIAVLAAKPLGNRWWRLATFIPIVVFAALTIPIDLFSWYVPPPMKPMRVFIPRSPGGQKADRSDYRARARRLEPVFGAVAGVRYALDRSPDGMFSLMSRIASERLVSTGNARWLRIAGCENFPGALPRAMFVPLITGAGSVSDWVTTIESPRFNERQVAVGPPRLDGFRSPPSARVVSVEERPQLLSIRVSTPQPAVLLVNETYFRAWDAGAFATFPLNLDRLGIGVPAGEHTINLRFGRRRTAVAAAWAISLLVLVIAAGALRVEVFDRRPREIQRAADEDRGEA